MKNSGFIKRLRLRSLVVWLFLPVFSLQAQDEGTENIGKLVADILERYAEELGESIDYESFYDDLLQLASEPMDLNAVSKDELERLPFLSDSQIENLLYYLYTFGPMQTIYELRLIDGLDMTDIRRLLPFVYVGEPKQRSGRITWANLLRHGKSNLLLRMDRGLEGKAGYLPAEGKGKQEKYLGDPFYASLRYRFRYSKRIQAGFTGEKDAGEVFWSERQKGFDFYSAHLQIENIGKLKTLVVGDFKANFGQGLVVRQDFTMRKSPYVVHVSPRNQGFRKYSGSNEYRFFRGVAASVEFEKWTLSAFYSNKQLDADTLGASFGSFYRYGLHRTASELKKKHSVNEQLAGANLRFLHRNAELGATLLYGLFDRDFRPRKTFYNYFYFSGREQFCLGLSYRLRYGSLSFSGETAWSGKNALATLNILALTLPSSRAKLVLLQRYFAPEYQNFYAAAFSEQAALSNECGIYLGVELHPAKYWKIAAYADSYAFPWLRYRTASPSFGADYLLQADYTPGRNLSMFWRVKYESKQENNSNSTARIRSVVPRKQSSWRYGLDFICGNLSFRTQLDANILHAAPAKAGYGFGALQELSCRFRRLPLRLSLLYRFFDARAYANRLYAYEKDIPYVFSLPVYYGLGSRCSLILNYEINSALSLWLKLAQTLYADDRRSIGTGGEEIRGNRKTDLRFLLCYRF